MIGVTQCTQQMLFSFWVVPLFLLTTTTTIQRVHGWQAAAGSFVPPVPLLQLQRQTSSRTFGFGSGRSRSRRRSGSSSSLQMVLTTPEAIIERTSTVKLIDMLIDESTRTSARRPIMMQWDPRSGWIWRRWRGTIFSETYVSCLRHMLYAIIVYLVYRKNPLFYDKQLKGLNILWGQLLSVTTFTLTFFVNQSYALWRKCHELSRRLQGRLHDVNMSLAVHAAREKTKSKEILTTPNPGGGHMKSDTSSVLYDTSTYTSSAKQLLALVSRYVRLFNLLMYASFTRSHRPILTPLGMRRLVERGLMTPQEKRVLSELKELPVTQRHNCVLMWIIRVFVEGRKAGHLVGNSGFEQQFLEKCHVIRSQYGAIGDELQGRMPLAYTHIVQVLVDAVLWIYPIMAFTSGMSPALAIVGSGLLTISYQGLFDLSKQFLDPYDNENYGKGEDPMCVDTLIAETNAGSLRWINGMEELPFSPQRIKDGNLADYVLPVRGYSAEQLEERTILQQQQQQLQQEEELLLQLQQQQQQQQQQKEAAEKEAAAAAVTANDVNVAVVEYSNVTEIHRNSDSSSSSIDVGVAVVPTTITVKTPLDGGRADVVVVESNNNGIPTKPTAAAAAKVAMIAMGGEANMKQELIMANNVTITTTAAALAIGLLATAAAPTDVQGGGGGMRGGIGGLMGGGKREATALIDPDGGELLPSSLSEEEWLETEAIMNAAPNSESIKMSEIQEEQQQKQQQVQQQEDIIQEEISSTEEDQKQQAQEQGVAAAEEEVCIAALEMDTIEFEEVEKEVSSSMNEDKNGAGSETETNTDTDTEIITSESRDDDGKNDNDDSTLPPTPSSSAGDSGSGSSSNSSETENEESDDEGESEDTLHL